MLDQNGPCWLAGLGASALLACGPSVQSIHQSNQRFEHCYRLDLDPQLSPLQRESCWRDWLARYTYGETRDRIDYAQRRVRSFADGDRSCIALKLTGEQRPANRDYYLVVPAPTNPHAPPAPIATLWPSAGTGETAPPKASGGAAAELARCSAACRSAWERCKDAHCPEDYRGCLQACINFK